MGEGQLLDVEPPICPVCGVTMVPAELSAFGAQDREWVCLECEDSRRLDGGDPGAEAPAWPAPERD
jgi:hypothetical protein